MVYSIKKQKLKEKRNKRERKKPTALGGHTGPGFKSELEYSEFTMTPWLANSIVLSS